MTGGVVAVVVWAVWAIWLTGRRCGPLDVTLAMAGSAATYLVVAAAFSF